MIKLPKYLMFSDFFPQNYFEIYRYYSLAGSTIQITDNSKNDINPQVSDLGYIVWEHEFSSFDIDIYAYDGITDQVVAGSGFNEIDPMIAGNQIAWQAFDGDDFEIYTAEIV